MKGKKKTNTKRNNINQIKSTKKMQRNIKKANHREKII